MALRQADEQAQYLWGLYTEAYASQLTPLELGKPLPASAIATTPKYRHDENQLGAAVRDFVPSWRKDIMWHKGAKSRKHGSPCVIVLASGARRCVKLLRYKALLQRRRSSQCLVCAMADNHALPPCFIRPLAEFKTRVAKLFAKHMTVEEQKTLLNTSIVSLAVGKRAQMPTCKTVQPAHASSHPPFRCMQAHRIASNAWQTLGPYLWTHASALLWTATLMPSP